MLQLETMDKNTLTEADSSTPSGTFLRELGISERLSFFVHKNRPTQFSVAAEIVGDFTAKTLRAALAKVQARHPLLRVSIQSGKSSPAFYEAQDTEIPLRVVAGEVSPAWEREMEREMSEPIDAVRAPLLRAVLMHEPGRAVVLLTTHHAITDGISMTFVIRDLLRALAGEPFEALPVPPPQEFLGRRCPKSLLQLRRLRHLRLERRQTMWLKERGRTSLACALMPH